MQGPQYLHVINKRKCQIVGGTAYVHQIPPGIVVADDHRGWQAEMDLMDIPQSRNACLITLVNTVLSNLGKAGGYAWKLRVLFFSTESR